MICYTSSLNLFPQYSMWPKCSIFPEIRAKFFFYALNIPWILCFLVENLNNSHGRTFTSRAKFKMGERPYCVLSVGKKRFNMGHIAHATMRYITLGRLTAVRPLCPDAYNAYTLCIICSLVQDFFFHVCLVLQVQIYITLVSDSTSLMKYV